MRIPYRTRRLLGRIGLTALVLFIVLALVWLLWFLWLGRFVVYDDDGARLDFDQSSVGLSGQPAVPPEEESRIPVYYYDGDKDLLAGTELTQMTGYYIDGDMLKSDIASIRATLSQLPAGTAVMVDVKNGFGEFYYSSDVGTYRNRSIDPEEMDGLISHLNKSHLYTVARLPAFRDYHYGLNHVDDGLFSAHGAYLWEDEEGCYWLNPTREGTVSYLVRIINELKQLGFDEVVFDEFYFPVSENYTFPDDRYQTLTTVSNTLVSSCSTDTFAVSFIGDSSFPLPQGRSRLYMEQVEASDVEELATEAAVPDTMINLVFLTELHDTRFDTYSVLRPITSLS